MVVLMQQAAVDIEGPAGKERGVWVWLCLVSTGWVLTGSQRACALNTPPGLCPQCLAHPQHPNPSPCCVCVPAAQV